VPVVAAPRCVIGQALLNFAHLALSCSKWQEPFTLAYGGPYEHCARGGGRHSLGTNAPQPAASQAGGVFSSVVEIEQSLRALAAQSGPYRAGYAAADPAWPT